MPSVRSRWPIDDPTHADRLAPRTDFLIEGPAPSPDDEVAFELVEGPFRSYRRTLRREGDEWVEETRFHLAVPWFAWVFIPFVRRALKQPPRHDGRLPWWSPPDRLDARASTVLGLLAAASLAVGYLNTLFTQTVAFAADEFGASEGAQGVAGTVVRCGIVFSVALTFLADRRGRRQILVIGAISAPILCALGALAPSFAALTATQTLGRPIAITLGLIIGIVAAEEMPRGSRAFAISVLAMASGLGAGLCVMALPLADLGTRGWRLVYVLSLLFLIVGVDLARRLPESRRFEQPHAAAPPFHRKRFVLLAMSGFLLNLLVAPASFFGNRYLKVIRGYSALEISLFTLCTNTPGGIGIIAGGRLADVHGRKVVGAVAVAVGAIATAVQFSVGGAPMWTASIIGAVVGAAAVPALGVYGAELFPTGHRGRASGLISVTSLVGSSVGLLVVGAALDAGWSYGAVMSIATLGPLIVAGLVLFLYPETAHRELEDINPEDRVAPTSSTDIDEPAR